MKPHILDKPILRDFFWFIVIDFAARVTRLHRTEAAAPRTDFAHQHESGSATGPAFAHVRAVRLLAHGAQAVFADIAFDRLEAAAAGRLDAQPVGFFQDRRIGFVLLPSFLAYTLL